MAAFDGVAQRAARHQIALAVVGTALVDVVNFKRIAQLSLAVSALGQLPHAHKVLGATA